MVSFPMQSREKIWKVKYLTHHFQGCRLLVDQDILAKDLVNVTAITYLGQQHCTADPVPIPKDES